MSAFKSILKWSFIGAAIIIVISIVAAVMSSDKSKVTTANASASNAKADKQSGDVQIGEILHTEYFDVSVEKVMMAEKIETGNIYADPKPDAGSRFISFKTTFKNTDTESRMILDGTLVIYYNGKEYKFDKSETILADGWGLLLDQINPLVSKTTRIVYKIPNEIEGHAFYIPGRAESNQRIVIGNIEKK